MEEEEKKKKPEDILTEQNIAESAHLPIAGSSASSALFNPYISEEDEFLGLEESLPKVKLDFSPPKVAINIPTLLLNALITTFFVSLMWGALEHYRVIETAKTVANYIYALPPAQVPSF